jgi:hypothetical protein
MKPVSGHSLGFEAQWKRNLLAVMFSLLLTSLPILGQEKSGIISGTVIDPTGAVIPEVKVVVNNLASGRSLTTTTGGDGTYRLQEIEPGRYSVIFEKSGFAKYEVPDSLVLVGKTLRVDAAMTVGSLTQTVEVTGTTPQIDTSSTMVAHNVTADEFDRLPKPRNFDGIAIFSPSVNTGLVEGGYQINGASNAENNYYIDGVSTNSQIDGSLRQSAKFEHLEEVQVKTTGIEAEYGGALGGVVSGITKSGGNQFHGSAYWFYYGSRLNVQPPKRMAIDLATKYTLAPSWNYIYDTKSPNNNYDAGGTFGGPIMKDKLFFFTSFAPTWQRRTVRYNFSDGPGTMDRKALFMSWFNKIDFNPTSRIRTNFTWLYTPTYLTGSLFAYNEMCQNCSSKKIADAAAEAQNGFIQPEQSMTGTINVTLSPSAILSIKGGRYYLNYRETGDYPATEIWWSGSSVGIPGIDPALEHDAGYTTSPPSGHVAHDITTRTYIQADVSKYLHLGGEHDLKFGVGTTKNVNNVSDLGVGTNGRVTLYLGALSKKLLGQVLPVGPYGYYTVDDRGTIGSTGALITHLYVQDAWRIRPRLTLNLGLRTERETIPSYRRDLKPYAFKFGFGDKIAPRLGASYDLFGNGKVKLSGFWGRFFDWTKFDLARGSFGGDTWRAYYRTLDTLDFNTLGLSSMPGTDLLKEAGGGAYTDLRLPDFSAIDPNIKPMSVDQANFGMEAEIMPQTVLSVRYVHSKLNRTIEDLGSVDANGSFAYTYGNPGEGKNLYYSPASLTCTVTVGGNCVDLMPKAKRQYDAFQVELTRRFSKGFLFDASYVYSRLYGNYSGIASTDEIRPTDLGYGFGPAQTLGAITTRPGGNASIYYDLDWESYDALGHDGNYGRLPSDRPHALKLATAYQFKFGTQVGMFFRATSGTPVSSIVNSDYYYPLWPNGRGDMGRTPAISSTDVMIAHEFRFGEVKKLRLEFNAMNLFSQKTSQFTWDRYNYEEIQNSIGVDLFNVNLDQGFAWQSAAKAATLAQGVALDPRYGNAAEFRQGFQGRFGVKFVF